MDGEITVNKDNILEWLEAVDKDPGYGSLTEEEIAREISVKRLF